MTTKRLERSGKKTEALRAKEQFANLAQIRTYAKFSSRIRRIGERLRAFVESEIARNNQLSVYGASTKGNTLLQVFRLDRSLIRSAAERNPEKWGKYTVGTWIPIVSEAEARAPMIFWCCRGTSWMKLRRASTIFWRGVESSSRRCRICACLLRTNGARSPDSL